MKNNDKKKEETKKKKINNYLALILLFIACISLVLYISELFKLNEAEKKKIPIIKGTLSEIYQEDLDHYVLDTPEAIVYVCIANSDNCRSFERDFKKLLKNKPEYNNQIIYLNLTDVDQEYFIDSFNSKYQYKKNLSSNYPAFIVFEDGKVKSILQGKENAPLTISKVKQFLELNIIQE